MTSRLVPRLFVVLGLVAASLSGVTERVPPAAAATFDRAGAAAYAIRYSDGSTHNPRYYYFPDANCTNFVSQAWHEGGRIPMNPRRWFYATAGDYGKPWTVAKDFRSYWYERSDQVAYRYFYGDKLAGAFNAANKGDAIVWERGDSAKKWNWSHVEIEVYWNSQADFVAKNTKDRITRWNTFHYNSTPTQQKNQREHGFRILTPFPVYS